MITRPTDTRLLTGNEQFTDMLPLIKAEDDKLRAHMALHFTKVHPVEWKATARDSFDAAQHKTGRTIITVTINGNTFNLPADARENGPPQYPKITGPVPTFAFDLFPPGGSNSNTDQGFFQCTVTGTLPIVYRWQVLKVGQWVDLLLSDEVSGTGAASNGDGFDVDYIHANTTALKITSAHPGSGEERTIQFRMSASNEAIGGAIRYSDSCSYRVRDET
jgi:hypothetical protein